MQGKFTKPAVVSPDGVYIAIITDSQLLIRYARPETESNTLVRSISLPSTLSRSSIVVKFSQRTKTSASSPRPFEEQSVRVLVTDLKSIHVWDLLAVEWHACIENSFEGTTQSLANVEFGFFDHHLFAFFPFNTKVAIYDLSTGRTVEVRDPKMAQVSRGWGFRPRTGHLALLTRSGSAPGAAPVDMVSLFDAVGLELLRTVTVATSDAKGIRWSRDGNFFAVWDAAVGGMRVLVYMADGTYYRTYEGQEDGIDKDLGLRTLDWSPAGDYLAIGGHDDIVVLLGTKTFAPLIRLLHDPKIDHSRIPVWQEHLSVQNVSSFERALQPILPHTLTVPTGQKPGVPFVSFNTDGSLLATRHEAVPNTVWIWSMRQLKPEAVVVCRAPIQQSIWHPKDPNRLLLTSLSKETFLYVWQKDQSPWSTPIPLDASVKYEARWLPGKEEDSSTIFVGAPNAFVVGKLIPAGLGQGFFEIMP